MFSSMRKAYPTDLSDAEWTRLQSYLPTPKAQGRPRTHSLRDVLDAIFYVLKSGCHGLRVPHDFPPWGTVYYFSAIGSGRPLAAHPRSFVQGHQAEGGPGSGGFGGDRGQPSRSRAPVWEESSEVMTAARR